MAKTKTKQADWKQRLLCELRRDKKRAVVLALLLVVALIVVGRQLLKSAPPSKVRAAAAAPAVADGPAAQYVEPVGPVEPGRPAPDVSTPGPEEQTDWATHRDIFVPELDLFPPRQEPTDAGKATVTSAPSAAHMAAKTQAIKAQAEALVLQSTVLCERPMAIINGKVLSIGDWISGFEVVSIRARACDVKKDDVEITLEMKE